VKKRIAYTSLAAVLFGATAIMADAYAAKGGIPGPPDGGEEGAGNRLSYPAVLIPGLSITPFFQVLEGELGVTYSYGCPGTEMLEQFEYPNISCVDDLTEPMEYYTAAQCTAKRWTASTGRRRRTTTGAPRPPASTAREPRYP